MKYPRRRADSLWAVNSAVFVCGGWGHVTTYGRCPATGGVRLREVSAYGWCPATGGVRLWVVSGYGRCPPTGGVRLREVSGYGRCPPTGGVRLREVSGYGRCPPTGGVRLREVSVSGGATVQSVAFSRTHPSVLLILLVEFSLAPTTRLSKA